jgi:hypothetical protein
MVRGRKGALLLPIVVLWSTVEGRRVVVEKEEGSRNLGGMVEVGVGRHDGRKKKASTRGMMTRRSR